MNSTSLSSGLKTSDTAILDRRGILTGVMIVTDKTNDASLIIYDNASAASGTALFKGLVVGTEDSRYFDLGSLNVRCVNGLYADVSGTGAEYIVYYK